MALKKVSPGRRSEERGGAKDGEEKTKESTCSWSSIEEVAPIETRVSGPREGGRP